MRSFPPNLFLVLMAIGTGRSAIAQGGSFEKVVTAPVFSIDGIARAAQVAPDQGSTVFVSNVLIGQLGDADMLLLRMNGSGTIVQDLAIGDAGGQGYHDVAKELVQADKNYYLTGYTRAIDTSDAHAFSAFLIKVDTALHFAWQRNYIIPDGEMYGETITPYGAYDLLITGKIYADNDFKAFVMRTDSTGTPVWIKQYEMPLGENIECARRLSCGDILLSGSMIFGFELVLPFVCKLNAEGDFLWGKYYNYPPGFVERSSFQFIHVSSVDDIQLAGYTDKFSPGGTDLFVVDIDSSGAVNWARTYGGSQFDEPNMVQFDNTAHELVLVGSSGSFAALGTPFPMAVRIATDGDLIGAALYGDTSVYQAGRFYHSSRVAANKRLLMGSRDFPADDLYLVGTDGALANACEYHPITMSSAPRSTGTGPFPAIVTVPEPLVNDSALAHYRYLNEQSLCDQATGVEEGLLQTGELTLFPSPGIGTFRAIMPKGFASTGLRVFDVQGRQVFSVAGPVSEVRLPAVLGPGTYVVQAMDRTGRRLNARYQLH